MTKYFCLKCNVQMKATKEPVGIFRYVIKCPKCGTEVVVDHKEDLG